MPFVLVATAYSQEREEIQRDILNGLTRFEKNLRIEPFSDRFDTLQKFKGQLISEIQTQVNAGSLTMLQLKALNFVINHIPNQIFVSDADSSSMDAIEWDFGVGIRLRVPTEMTIILSPRGHGESAIGKLLHESGHLIFESGVSSGLVPSRLPQFMALILKEVPALLVEQGSANALSLEPLKQRYKEVWDKMLDFFPEFESFTTQQKINLVLTIKNAEIAALMQGIDPQQNYSAFLQKFREFILNESGKSSERGEIFSNRLNEEMLSRVKDLEVRIPRENSMRRLLKAFVKACRK